MDIPEQYKGKAIVAITRRPSGDYDPRIFRGNTTEEANAQLEYMKGSLPQDKLLVVFRCVNDDFYWKVFDYTSRLDPTKEIKDTDIRLEDILRER